MLPSNPFMKNRITTTMDVAAGEALEYIVSNIAEAG